MMFVSMHALETHCLYRVNLLKDKITLLPLNTEWFINAAKSNKISLPYVIRKRESIEEILFTATSEEWMKFLEQNGENPSIYDSMATQTLRGVD
jgi:hypothetical protein